MLQYTNPVYPHYFADPFVWEHEGVYYAIGTGRAEAGGGASQSRVIPLLRSADLVNWQFVHHALIRPDPALGPAFWAPEVACADGRFYMYYSVGWDTEHQLRVASSEVPQGPYRDVSDAPLIDPKALPFAIDAHPYRDADGQWYLFYARDFLDTDGGVRAGTAVVVDRLLSMTQLAGEARPIIRATCEWQRYEKDRAMYGGVYDWHTIEGPCVRRHGGKYYCFYSGGCWRDEGYGVDYAVADHVDGPYSSAGGEDGPRILRTIPGHVRGPGHNSIVRGPDGHDFVVYHAWDEARTARKMCIDRIEWTPDGPRCSGPTWTPQSIHA